jgi:hypothetical protein
MLLSPSQAAAQPPSHSTGNGHPYLLAAVMALGISSAHAGAEGRGRAAPAARSTPSDVMAAPRSAVQSSPSREAATSPRDAQADAPARINGCDGGGCSDTQGNRYNGASGKLYLDSEGRRCVRSGAWLQCN